MSDEQTAFERIEQADAEVRAGPHAWIQWKGTTVCMNVRCSCGARGHVDAEFAYRVQCAACDKVWHVSGNVRLVEELPEDRTDGWTPPIKADEP